MTVPLFLTKYLLEFSKLYMTCQN